jgi:pimeloyl-ACP methyl ester carboxylesterase
MKRPLGIILFVLYAPFVLFVMTGPPSPSGALYVLAPVVLLAAFVVPRKWSRRTALASVAIFFAPMLARVAFTKPGGDVRAIDRIVDERDMAVNASRAIAYTHFMKDPDVPELPNAMRDAYDLMAQEEGNLPSPFAATYLGLQRPGASDAIEFMRDGDAAVVFLHGSAGNFTMSCWLFARAATQAGLSTTCPSTTWVGDWWSRPGEKIVRDSIASLRARGKTRIYLAGLSNGGIGASRLAPRLADEDLAGLVLVSGAAPDASSSHLPTLVVQGRGDTQVSAAVVRAYATRANAKYVELAAGHFVLLVEREKSQRAITTWLLTQESSHALAAAKSS